MGVSIDYRCQSLLNAAQRRQLMERVEADVAAFSWWAESINLWEGDGGLQGSTKLFILCDDVDADSIMAWWNTTHILKLLQAYARDYGLEWSIEIEGMPFGEISGDESDAEVFVKANEMLRLADIEADDPGLPQRIREIDAKYSDRWS